MYAKKLEISNFKCFSNAHMALQYPGRKGREASPIANINVVVGDNGGGKSSVLRGLALAMLAPLLPLSGFVPYRLVRRPGVNFGNLSLDALPTSNERKMSRTFSRPNRDGSITMATKLIRGKANYDQIDWRPSKSSFPMLLAEDSGYGLFLAAYGATRHVEPSDYSESSSRKARGARYQRVASLFEDHVALRPIKSWYPKLTARERRTAARQLNKILPKNIRLLEKFDHREEEALFSFEGKETPFSSLSDGYKAFIAWTSELVSHLLEASKGRGRIDRVPGIVLVDEIDLHLHPRWQKRVVPMLASAFPNIQFVFTTHSPLIVSNVHALNVFVTDTDDQGNAIVRQLKEQAYGRSAEQLLMSTYFGMKSTRPESFTDKSRVLFRRAAEGDLQAALAYLDYLNGDIDIRPDKRPTGRKSS